MLRAAIKKFAHYEKHWTYTRFNISYAKKLAFTQFLNTAIIPYIVNIHFNVARLSLKAQQKMDIAGGLIEDIHFIILLDMMLPLVNYFFNIWHIFRLFKRWRIRSGGRQDLTQK